MIEISPSVLGADLMRLGEEIKLVEKLGITWLHLDHMDGHFVPNISFGPDFVSAMRKETRLFLDVHLMLSNPMKYIRAYAKAGADLITVHVEAEDDAETMLREIREQGIKAGISIKPGTDPEAIRHLLPLCDLVLVMTVEPGFGGQKFMASMMPKVTRLRQLLDKVNPSCHLEVDGGVDKETYRTCMESGADVLVAGSAFFRSENPEALRRLIEA